MGARRLCRCLRFGFPFIRGVCKFLLDAARQFVLPFGRDEGVFAGHLQIAVAGDLRRLDGAAADLLPPGNVRAPERVRPEPREVAALGLRSLVERVANARVPERFSRRALLLEDERIRRGVRPRRP